MKFPKIHCSLTSLL